MNAPQTGNQQEVPIICGELGLGWAAEKLNGVGRLRKKRQRQNIGIYGDPGSCNLRTNAFRQHVSHSRQYSSAIFRTSMSRDSRKNGKILPRMNFHVRLLVRVG